MDGAASEAGVEEANIELIGPGIGIVSGEILLHAGIGKSLSVNGDGELGEGKGARFFDGVELDILRR